MSLHFNFDDYKQALTTPSITINGVTYTAEPLSFRDTLALRENLIGIEWNSLTADQFTDLVEVLCEKAKIPLEPLQALPFDALLHFVICFFRYLFPNLGVENSNTNPTNGTEPDTNHL